LGVHVLLTGAKNKVVTYIVHVAMTLDSDI